MRAGMHKQNKWGGKRINSGRKKKEPSSYLSFRISLIDKENIYNNYGKTIHILFKEWISNLLENSNEVIDNIKSRIDQIQKTLPEGVVIEPFLDRTKMVNNAIGTVEKNLLEGALIVVFILVLFLGNFRAGLLVAAVLIVTGKQIGRAHV